jgi:endogenous inhibitor of DNA gyrase (YacG/DUF329 family)
VVLSDEGRRCETCGAVLAQTSRRDRRFCSQACRQAAYAERRAEQAVSPLPVPAVADLERLLANGTREDRLVARIAAHAGADTATS